MTAKIIPPQKGLTDAFIKHLKPQESRYEVADNACAGLRVRIGTTGKKSFVWLYSDPETKKLKRLTLGRYGIGDDQLTLSTARKALETAKIKLDAGDLNNIASNTPKTVSELCDVFYEKRILPHLRRPDVVQQVIEHDIKPVIGTKNISTISTVALTKCIDIVVERNNRAKLDTAGDIKREVAKLYRESRSGLMGVNDLSKYSYVLNNLAKIIESSELEERLEQLENQ